MAVEQEIAGEVTHITTDMQEFVNKQLPGWIHEGVVSGLRNLPQAPSALTIEQIREVVQTAQLKANPFKEEAQKERREREYQKEKESFTRWLQEQWKQAEAEMEKRLAEKTEQLRRIVSKPPTIREEEEEGEASGATESRFSWRASQIQPDLPELPATLKEPAPPPPFPPKSRRRKAPPTSSSSSSSSFSDKGRQHGSWTNGPKERKKEKYLFKVKAP
jgi:hypothetical protein